MCVVGIRRNSTSMRGSRSHLCRLLGALRHLRTPILGCILVGEKNSHFASVFCLYLRRFRRGFGLFPSYMTLRSARVWFLVLFRHFKFSSKSLRRPYTPKTQVPYIQIHPTKKTTTQPNLNHHTSTRPPHIQFQDSKTKTTTHRQLGGAALFFSPAFLFFSYTFLRI